MNELLTQPLVTAREDQRDVTGNGVVVERGPAWRQDWTAEEAKAAGHEVVTYLCEERDYDEGEAVRVAGGLARIKPPLSSETLVPYLFGAIKAAAAREVK